MSNGHHQDSQTSFPLRDTTAIRTDAKTLVAIIGTAIALAIGGAVAWASVKGDITDHAKQLEIVQLTLRTDHDLGVQHTAQIDGIAKTLDRLERKVDYLTGARRERPPADGK